MSPNPLAAGLVGLALLAVPTPSQQVETAPDPAWVDPVDVPPADARAEGTAELLLLDYQTRLGDPVPERHVHVALHVLNETGVREQSDLTVDFDPSYEELSFHSVVLHRDGERLDRLEGRTIEVLQREQQLDQHLYSGARTALLILDDVRPGDVLEYAYTVRGRSPVFDGRYFGGLQMEFGVAVERLRHRLLVPSGRRLEVREHGIELEPEIRDLGGETEYVWSRTAVERADWEVESPSWYEPFAWVQVSEYADWAEVARWGEALFALDGPPDEELVRLADEVREVADAPLERLHAALRLVQARVRYFGVMLGEGSHRPSDPAEVLGRRYGDCKDKARLLIELLRELDIEARPALVSTTHRGHIAKQLPSPGAFDHVIVRAVVEGDDVWVDPTNDSERGPLDEHALRDPGLALVLAPGTNELTEVLPGLGAEPTTHVNKRVRVAWDGSAEVELDTVYAGADANGMRARLASIDRETLTEQYLDYFCGNEFPEATSMGPVEVQPDERRNLLVVKERYSVPDVYDRTGPEPQVVFWPAELHEELLRPSSTRRSAPFALPHPRNVDYHLQVDLPYVIGLLPGKAQVHNPAFRYESSTTKEGRRLQLRYSYATRKDHVCDGSIARYAADIERAENDLGLVVTPPENPAAGPPAFGIPGGSRVSDLAAAEAFGNLIGMGLFAALIAWAVRESKRRARGSTEHADPGNAPAVRRHGDVVELDPWGDLPARCVRCNRPATSRKARKFRYHAPGWYLLLFFLFLLPYFFIAPFVSERRRVTIGRCRKHRGLQLAGCWGSALLGLLAVAMIWVGPDLYPEVSGYGLWLLAASGLWAAVQGSRAVRVKYIGEELTRLTGFGQAFLESLPNRWAIQEQGAHPIPWNSGTGVDEPGPWSSEAPLPKPHHARALQSGFDAGLADWNHPDRQ